MNARSSACRRALSCVVNSPSGAVRSRMAPVKSGAVRPTSWWAQALAEDARLEPEVRPERRPDEADVVDGDSASVEPGHSVLEALSGEFASRHFDVVPVELVVPRDIEDALGTGPAFGDVPDPAGVHRSEVAGEDDEFGVGGERGDEVTVELDVQVGEDLDSHAGGRDYSPFHRSGEAWIVPASRRRAPCRSALVHAPVADRWIVFNLADVAALLGVAFGPSPSLRACVGVWDLYP